MQANKGKKNSFSSDIIKLRDSPQATILLNE
jgi:hypothetical protein